MLLLIKLATILLAILIAIYGLRFVVGITLVIFSVFSIKKLEKYREAEMKELKF